MREQLTRSKFAIVIPAYNAERFVAESLNSLLRQTEPSWRAIVVDDGSSDGTASVVSGFTDPRIELHRKTNGGVSSARNHGLALVAEEFLVFLDADDLMLPDSLARLHSALLEDDRNVLAYGESRVFHDDPEAALPFHPPVLRKRPDGENLAAFLISNPIATGGAAMRSSRVREIGGFDEELTLGEDWEFYARLVANRRIRYLSGPPVLLYRTHPSSAVRNLAADSDLLMKSVERIFENPEWQQHLDPKDHQSLHTKAKANVLSFSATEMIKASNWSLARSMLLKSLALDFWRLRSWILLACAVIGFVPRPVRERLK